MSDPSEWHYVCSQCGPRVVVDEDECCATCGCSAFASAEPWFARALDAARAEERARCLAVVRHAQDEVDDRLAEAAVLDNVIGGIRDGDDPRYFVPTCEDVQALREEIAELQAQLHDDPDVKAARAEGFREGVQKARDILHDAALGLDPN